MDISPLTLSDKPLLYERLRAVTEPVSEYTFANLYLFREAHQYEVLREGDAVFLRGRNYEGQAFLMPTADMRAFDADHLRRLLAETGTEFLFPIPEAWMADLEAKGFTGEFSEADSDYMFETAKMTTYAGHDLHKKRTQLRRFDRDYAHDARSLTEERHADALAVLEQWMEDLGVPPEETDYHAAREALERCEELVLCGFVYYVEDKPVGYILGDELNDETFALHFAKAKRGLGGIYEFIYNSFAHILPERYRYMNFEQDLGKEALRRAKSAYRPDLMVRKYRVA